MHALEHRLLDGWARTIHPGSGRRPDEKNDPAAGLKLCCHSRELCQCEIEFEGFVFGERAPGKPGRFSTSFNVRGEPIVCTPEDSFRCFMGTDIEVLAVENCVLERHQQDPALERRYETRFDFD